MGAVAAGAGQYCQRAQVAALIFQGAGFQALLQTAYSFADGVIRVCPGIFFMSVHTGFTQSLNASP